MRANGIYENLGTAAGNVVLKYQIVPDLISDEFHRLCFWNVSYHWEEPAEFFMYLDGL